MQWERNRIFKILKDFATPVQYSVFEAQHLNDLVMLRFLLVSAMNTREDSIIFYRQCQSCYRKADKIGVNRLVCGEGDILI